MTSKMIKAVAWAGELMLCESRWTDKDGHTVKFRIVTPNEERPNPFKAFTKRRSGKAGTRFHMSAAHVVSARTPTEIAYNGEAMLAGWSDTNSTGYCVTFWVQPPDAGAHPFEKFSRNVDSFMVALVELDDNEMAIDQEKRERVESPAHGQVAPTVEQGAEVSRVDGSTPSLPTNPERKAQRLSTVAALMCNNREFQQWIGADGADQAAHWMRTKLGIASRSVLDDPAHFEIARAFHEQIRRPFADREQAGYRRA